MGVTPHWVPHRGEISLLLTLSQLLGGYHYYYHVGMSGAANDNKKMFSTRPYRQTVPV